VSDERCVFEVVFLEEGLYILGKCGVGMCLIVGRFSMVAEVEGVNGAGEGAGKGAVDPSVRQLLHDGGLGVEDAYLLTLLLFFLLPKRPWRIMIGAPFDLP
jgi:hypothetical protein